jgi:hypothetical protein
MAPWFLRKVSALWVINGEEAGRIIANFLQMLSRTFEK